MSFLCKSLNCARGLSECLQLPNLVEQMHVIPCLLKWDFHRLSLGIKLIFYSHRNWKKNTIQKSYLGTLEGGRVSVHVSTEGNIEHYLSQVSHINFQNMLYQTKSWITEYSKLWFFFFFFFFFLMALCAKRKRENKSRGLKINVWTFLDIIIHVQFL